MALEQCPDLLNQVLCISNAAVQEKGEDAYACTFCDHAGMVAVFDGCGGLGAKQYSRCKQHSAAYLAARLAAHTAMAWFDQMGYCNENGLLAATNQGIGCLKDMLAGTMQHAKQMLDDAENQLFGTMVKSFPTTASIALMAPKPDRTLDCTFIWAGDSRGYILQPDGLKQCTDDDLRGGSDPFDNLYEDSPLSNMVNGDGSFTLNVRRVNCSTPAIVFTATDGTFGYLPSPMHYEWLILRTLRLSDSFADWENRLQSEIASTAGDDSTLVLAVYGWQSFLHMKQAFMLREKDLTDMLSNIAEGEDLRQLWKNYSSSYCVCLNT